MILVWEDWRFYFQNLRKKTKVVGFDADTDLVKKYLKMVKEWHSQMQKILVFGLNQIWKTKTIILSLLNFILKFGLLDKQENMV